MQTALLILPNFVLILIGLALARRFDFGRDFWDGLEKLVYYVLFPALLFRSLALAQIDFSATAMLVAAALGFTLAGFVLSIAAGPLFKLDRKVLELAAAANLLALQASPPDVAANAGDAESPSLTGR